MPTRRHWRPVLLLLLLGGSLYGLSQLELSRLLTVLRQAPPHLLVLGVLCNFLNLCSKASSWHFLLPARMRFSYLRLLRYSIAAGALNVVAPLRAGEGLRVYLLQTREGVPAATAIGVAVAEKMLNVVGLVLLVLPLPWLAPNLPGWLTSAALACAGVVAALALGLVLLPYFLRPGRFLRVRAACAAVRGQGWSLLPALACLVCGWLGDCALVVCTLRACNVSLSSWVAPFELFVINLAIVVPSTPAQVGTLELAAVGGLQLLGIDGERALAFALLYHAVQVVPLLVVAALEVRLLRDAARRMAGDASPTP